MEYDFDEIHRAKVKYQAADALSGLRNEGTDDSDIDDSIKVRTVASHAQSRLPEATDIFPKKDLIETKKPNLSTLEKFLSA